jgi:hypothetical protein
MNIVKYYDFGCLGDPPLQWGDYELEYYSDVKLPKGNRAAAA